MMQFTYFDRRELEWKNIPGRCYLVNLPIVQDVPALRDNDLIVHRNVNQNAPSTKAWTVTHRKTSFAIATGRTRAAAMAHAQAALLAKGNDMFLRAIAAAELQLASLQAVA